MGKHFGLQKLSQIFNPFLTGSQYKVEPVDKVLYVYNRAEGKEESSQRKCKRLRDDGCNQEDRDAAYAYEEAEQR